MNTRPSPELFIVRASTKRIYAYYDQAIFIIRLFYFLPRERIVDGSERVRYITSLRKLSKFLKPFKTIFRRVCFFLYTPRSMI